MQTEDNQGLSQAIAKIEIISFFRNNPHTRDTLEGLSRRLFLGPRLLGPVLEELANIGLINKSGSGKRAIYRLKVSYATLEEYQLSLMEGDSSWM